MFGAADPNITDVRDDITTDSPETNLGQSPSVVLPSDQGTIPSSQTENDLGDLDDLIAVPLTSSESETSDSELLLPNETRNGFSNFKNSFKEELKKLKSTFESYNPSRETIDRISLTTAVMNEETPRSLSYSRVFFDLYNSLVVSPQKSHLATIN